MDDDKRFCKHCGEKIDKDTIVCPKCGRQLKLVKNVETTTSNDNTDNSNNNKTNFYKTTWFMWVMLIFFPPVGITLMWVFHDEIKKNVKIILTVIFAFIFIMMFAAANSDESSTNDTNKTNSNSNTKVKKNIAKVEVIDFSTMNENEILQWCDNNKLNCNIKNNYSNTVKKGSYIGQSVKAGEKINEGGRVTITYSLGKEPTTEQKNALEKAKRYASTMNMSKQGIYDQLVSEYGENFDKESAQYAIDNLEWDWNKNALEKAKTYRETMNMSKNAIYDQLISKYGEQFTKKQAQYAIDHLDD